MAERGKAMLIPQGSELIVVNTITVNIITMEVAQQIASKIAAGNNVLISSGRSMKVYRHKTEMMPTEKALTIMVTYKATKNMPDTVHQKCLADAHRSVFEFAEQVITDHEIDGNKALGKAEAKSEDKPDPDGKHRRRKNDKPYNSGGGNQQNKGGGK